MQNKYVSKKYRKTNIEVWEIKIEIQKYSSKTKLHTILKKKENISTIGTKFDQYSNTFSIFETLKEAD